jgi:hypothetical protein
MLTLLLLFFGHFAHSSDTPQLDLFGISQALTTVARYCVDPVTLQSLATTNKALFNCQDLHTLYQERCNELKNYITDPAHGINSKLVTFARNHLRAYFIEMTKIVTKDQIPTSSLVSVSHYGDDYKKELIYALYDESNHKHNLSQRIKPLLMPDAVCMYGQYSTSDDTAGELMRVKRNGHHEKAYLYFQINNLLIPSGWLANLLPKMHDAVINTGVAHYTSWDACKKKSPLSKVRTKHAHESKSAYEEEVSWGDCPRSGGVVIFDLKDFTGIADDDRAIIDCVYRHPKDSNMDIIDRDLFKLRPTALMHMHFSWGHKKAVMTHRPSLQPVKHEVPGYGVFKVNAFNEGICFIPSGGIIKTVRMLHNGDLTCAHAFDNLKKQNVFVKKDWSVHADALFKALQKFATTRYTFQHNAQLLLVGDTRRSMLHVIRLRDDKKPTLRTIPSVILSSCCLTDGGCEYDIQPEQDAPKE